MLQSVSYGYCISRLGCCTCCNGCTRTLQAPILNVSYGFFFDVCYKCVYLDVAYVFTYMMQVFYLDVAYVYNGFKCFLCVFARRMFQMFICFHTYVAIVAPVCFKTRSSVAVAGPAGSPGRPETTLEFGSKSF
jgi:hypothetical protein